MNTSATTRQWGVLGLPSVYWLSILGLLAAMYLAGIYGSEIVAGVISRTGIDPKLLHEVFHDIRHAAGFMCH